MLPIQGSDVPSNKEYMFTMITSFSLIICHSCGCFQTTIYSLKNFYISLILQPFVFSRFFFTFYYGCCRLLADGMWILHLECCYSFITVLDRRSQPSHPWYSLWMCLHHLFLHLHQPHTMPTVCKTLFGCFVIALNAAFTQQLSLADEGYESGSDTVDLPTPLQKTPCIHHISSIEHASFSPVHTTPHNTVTITPHSSPQTPTRPVHCHLSFSLDTDHTPGNTPACSDSSYEEEEDCQMVPLDDKHWTTEEDPERTFCIYEHGLPHNLCQYPCPYGSNNTVSYMDSLDLSDISDYEDYMWWRITWNGRGTLLTLNSGLLEHLFKNSNSNTLLILPSGE